MKKIWKSLEKNKFNLSEVIVISIMTLIFGIFITLFINNLVLGNRTKLTGPLKDFYNTYKKLSDTYYEELDEKKLLESGINGMIDYIGDPYTSYMDSEAAASFMQEVEGYYIGFGMAIAKDNEGRIKIKELYSDGSAKKEGLKVNDVIIKVDDKDVTNLTTNELSTKLKGKQGTKSKVTVLREEKELSYTLTRTKVEIKSVTSEIIKKNNKNVGYIRIDIFAINTKKQFDTELAKLEKKGIDSLIIDVRDNQGGYLSTVRDIISKFVGKNKVVYQLEMKGKKEKIYSNFKETRNIPVVVLINAGSASASEVLASAFQETYEKSYIVGNTSFGKGTVQKTYSLSDGSMVKYTVEKWLTAKGKSIDGVGVKPDIEVDFDYESYYNNPTKENDTQLQKALEVLTNRKAE